MRKQKTYYSRILSVILSLLMVLSVVSFLSFKTKAAGTLDDFVERCYTVTLGRGSDPDGFADWKGQLLNGKAVGNELAYGFLFSPEYTGLNKSPEDYVTDLYMLFMGRTPDEEGFNDWVGQLKAGKTRLEIFAGFANSQEFYNLCDSYGISAGRWVNGYDRYQINNVNLFVERFYKTCLGRRGDIGGQKNWVEKLLKKEISGSECARSFIFSTEYTNKGLSDADYVENLYLALMGRSSDAEGKANWLNALASGKTRDEVFAGFVNSVEFANICKTYNIDKGSYTAKNVGDKYTNFTMFTTMEGIEINSGNEIQEIIAQKTGVKVKETWLAKGQKEEEAIDSIIASGQYPDFIDAGYSSKKLYELGKLVAWDPYLEKYPNLKEMYTDAEWDEFRQDDGKIYWANVWNNTYGEDKSTMHNDEAFWIQVRVLEWAGYPEIKTMDEYFDLLEKYYASHKSFVDPKGKTVNIIPYTILCDDWRYFCLENAPMYLDGNPDNGSVIVDPKTMKVVDYNTTSTAKTYFKKLNEEYNKGIVDKDFATQNWDQYIDKLSTGAVLGMIDQTWDFNYDISYRFANSGLDKLGCEYVPLGITADGVTENRWHSYGDTLNNSSGIAVTTNCKNPDKAFEFLNSILSQEIHDLRFWGVQGVDYLVDSNGLYYRTEEMRKKVNNPAYNASHMCEYSYMPQWLGTSRDGKNAMRPEEQPSEYYASVSEPLAKCFKAYNANGYPDMIGSVKENTVEKYPWYPMWSWSNELNDNTPGGAAFKKMTNTKHEWLPKVVMSSNFESDWSKYITDYKKCKPEDFLKEAQDMVDLRIKISKESK